MFCDYVHTSVGVCVCVQFGYISVYVRYHGCMYHVSLYGFCGFVSV